MAGLDRRAPPLAYAGPLMPWHDGKRARKTRPGRMQGTMKTYTADLVTALFIRDADGYTRPRRAKIERVSVRASNRDEADDLFIAHAKRGKRALWRIATVPSMKAPPSFELVRGDVRYIGG